MNLSGLFRQKRKDIVVTIKDFVVTRRYKSK